jgi:hypothetical protein
MINGACDLLLLPWYTLVTQYTYCCRLVPSMEASFGRGRNPKTEVSVLLVTTSSQSTKFLPILYNLACTSSYSEKARSRREAMVARR